MKTTMFLERLPGGAFRATCLSLPAFAIEAPTREEALSRLEELIRTKLADGEFVFADIVIPGEPNPVLALAGTWKDRDDMEDFEENIRAYRRQIDADPGRP